MSPAKDRLHKFHRLNHYATVTVVRRAAQLVEPATYIHTPSDLSTYLALALCSRFLVLSLAAAETTLFPFVLPFEPPTERHRSKTQNEFVSPYYSYYLYGVLAKPQTTTHQQIDWFHVDLHTYRKINK